MTKIKKNKISKKTPEIKSGSVGKKLMEEVLAKAKDLPKLPKIGDLIEGTIIEIGTNAIWLDLGPIGTGVIRGPEIIETTEMIENLKIGDKISATVLELENEEGCIELSLKLAGYERAWEEILDKMQKGEAITTKALEANRGGLMVNVRGVAGFLPVSQLAIEHYPRVEEGDKNKILTMLRKYIGKEFRVKIIDANRIEEKLIVSEKATRQEIEKQKIAKLKVGDVIEGMVSGIVDFGAFVKFGDNLEGLVHISELAWQLIDDPHKIVKVGEQVKAKIIGIDGTRISLSFKAITEDPWSKADEKYKIGNIVKGKVTKINPFGAFVYLDKDIHGLVHISQLRRDKTQQLVTLKLGQEYNFKILSLEPKEHRMGLTLVEESAKEISPEEIKIENGSKINEKIKEKIEK